MHTDSPNPAPDSPIGQADVEALRHLADSMGFGRTHDMLRRVIAATPYFSAPVPPPDGAAEASSDAGETDEFGYFELGRSFYEEFTKLSNDGNFKGFICGCSPIEILVHLINERDEAKAAAPQTPAPDAMREALQLIERTCHVRAATIARDVLRSAPVPPPDGASEIADLQFNLSEASAESGKLLWLIKEGVWCEILDKNIPLVCMDESDPSVGLDASPYLVLADGYQVIPTSLFEAIQCSMGDGYETCLDCWRQIHDPSYDFSASTPGAPPPSDDVRSALADEANKRWPYDEDARLRRTFVDGGLFAAALRSAPVSVSDADVAEIIKTLRNPGPDARKYSEFFNKAADALERLSAPAVGVTRERLLELAHDLDHIADKRSCLTSDTKAVRESAAALRLIGRSVSPAPDATVSEPDESRYINDIIENAMLTMWNEICSDTGCHPLDVDRLGGRKLGFHRDHWARMTAEMASSQILKLNLPSSSVSARDAVIEDRWQHVKRGTVYLRIGEAQVQAPEHAPLTDYELVTVYVREGSQPPEYWVRRNSEFHGGRFRSLTGAKP